MKRLYVVALAAALALAATFYVAPAAAQYVTQFYGRTFTSSAPSGSNGFVCRTVGCRLDLGTGFNDYMLSDGSSIVTGGSFIVGATASATTQMFAPAFTFAAAALGTCAAGAEGQFRRLTGTGGTSTGSQTRFCACVSDGAASPVYSWRNVISGTAGNATTCNP